MAAGAQTMPSAPPPDVAQPMMPGVVMAQPMMAPGAQPAMMAQPMMAQPAMMAQPMMAPGAQPMMVQPVMMAQPMMPGVMTQMNRGWMPQTVDQHGRALGARVPPSFWAKCCYPPCAISGYEHGDPTLGIFEGTALLALLLHIFCLMGCCVSLCCWQPNPTNIKGDGTQRTVQQRCLAGFCLGFLAISFWENGDFVCGPDGCTWCTTEAMKGCFAHFLPGFLGIPPLDCCYVMCFWEPDSRFFRRSLGNHGGGAFVVGAPVQTAGAGNAPLSQAAGPAPGATEMQGLNAGRL